jgi:hypothetical protein
MEAYALIECLIESPNYNYGCSLIKRIEKIVRVYNEDSNIYKFFE